MIFIPVIGDEYSVLYFQVCPKISSLSLFMISSEVTIFYPLERYSSQPPQTKMCQVP